MLYYAKSLLTYGDIRRTDKILEKIDQITAEQLLEVANEHLNEKDFHYLLFNGKSA